MAHNGLEEVKKMYRIMIVEDDEGIARGVEQQIRSWGMEAVTAVDFRNITAEFAASMARVGLALAFTYRSCIVEEPDVVYLSLGSQGLYLRLALLSPTTDYRSKATLALTKLLREELSGKNADKKTPSPSNQINEGAL